MTRGRIVVAALAATTVLCVLGAAWSVSSSAARTPADGSSQYYKGYYEANDPLNLSYATIPDGQYVLSYSMSMVANSAAPDALVNCSFVDPNGQIGYLSTNFSVSPADGTVKLIESQAAFDLPSITIALRCSPTVTGEFSAQFSNIAVSIERVGD